MIIFTFWSKAKVHQRFQKVGDRLVVLEKRTEMDGRAAGQEIQERETLRCSLSRPGKS